MIDSYTSMSSQTLGSPEEELPALSIWTFTLGVFALLTFGLTSVPSIICGHLALGKNNKASAGSLGKSVALVGLVIGYVGAIFLCTWILFLARMVG